MNTIRRIVLTIVVPLMAGAFSACTDYQDEIDALDYRVRVLENLVKSVNSELESLQRIVRAVEDGDYISNVTQNSEGYIFTFNKSGAIIIHDGIDGKDGKDGQDAQVPDITVKQDEDGYYYWTVNGEWLAGADGMKIRANGRDGKDGKDGVDGKDGE